MEDLVLLVVVVMFFAVFAVDKLLFSSNRKKDKRPTRAEINAAEDELLDELLTKFRERPPVVTGDFDLAQKGVCPMCGALQKFTAKTRDELMMYRGVKHRIAVTLTIECSVCHSSFSGAPSTRLIWDPREVKKNAELNKFGDQVDSLLSSIFNKKEKEKDE